VDDATTAVAYPEYFLCADQDLTSL
ncbi:MAG: hypothetical protein RLZZ429_1447, partial [Bacteroidota bacterium]